MNAPVPANNEEIAEVLQLVASEACPRRFAEQNVDPCVPLFMEETMEGFSFHLTMPPETYSNDFGGFLELFSRFEFEICRCGNYFLKVSNFWCVHVNVPWPVCAHAIPFRMLWRP